MKTLSIRDAIGITWDADGFCYGVRLHKVSGSYRVVSYWSETEADSIETPGCLARGLAALEKNENTIIIAGAHDAKAGLADVSLPVMSPNDLRNALNYEIGKHAPLGLETLSWGYRVLGKENGRLDIRLYYLRRTEWNKWTEIVSGMQHGVDMLLPPVAATDPVLEKTAVAVHGMPGMASVPVDGPGKGRELLPFSPDDERVFGALPKPLETPGLDPGDLGSLPETAQQGFAGAVVLAMYGLEGLMKRDSQTCPTLPAGIKLMRHRGSRMLTFVLAIYLFVIITFTFGVQYFSASSELHDIRSLNRVLTKQLDHLEKKDRPGGVFAALQEELKLLKTGGESSLPAALINLTELLDKSLWVSNFTWKNGRIEMDVRSAGDDTSFLQTLKESGLFTDIVPLRKVVDQRNAMTLKVQMRPVADDGVRMP